jgi:predicted dehydrogenase
MTDFDHISSNLPLRVVIAGAGAMGSAWARAVSLNPQFELVGIFDADQRRGKAVAIRLGKSSLAVGASLAALRGVTADACINATPPSEHYGVIDAALRAGLAVLSEKPFTDDLYQAARLTAAARSQRKLLMISQSRRYQPGLEVLRAKTRNLGVLHSLNTTFARRYPAVGFRAGLAQPLLTDMAVHAFDSARYVTGAEAITVYCDAVRRPESGYKGPPEATAVFEMSQGFRFYYSGSWCASGLPTSWSGQWRVVGAGGSAEWDGNGNFSLTTDVSPQGDIESVEDVDDAGFDADPVRQVGRPLAEFGDALTNGVAPWGIASNNLRTVAMVHGAIASAQRREPVRIDNLLRHAGAA